jgi:hypothetical protein
VSVSDDCILKWNGLVRGWSTYAYSLGYDIKACTASRTLTTEVTDGKCGRLLGLRFHYTFGNLYIVDAYKGLIRAGSGDSEANVLVTKSDGVSLRFTNGVDVDQITGEVFLQIVV